MGRHRARSAKKTKVGIDGYLLASGILFVALVLSLTAMQIASSSGAQKRVEVFAWCSAVTVCTSGLFLMLWAVRHNQRERLEKLKDEAPPVFNLNEDYRARHDVSDVIIYAIMGGGLMFVASGIGLHGHWLMGSVALALSLFGLVMFYKSLFFSVLFTDKLIVVEMKPFIKYSETWEAVKAIYHMGISRKIVFSDGKSVVVGYGIGDSRRIAAILKKHVHSNLWEPRLIWF
ncbi:MAG TPA: hypothetical protein VL135_05270 [Terracidiphilus sp.]|jgi:hypothetical protein|nr:hypothetical protein [Terracidiphilus sp.]